MAKAPVTPTEEDETTTTLDQPAAPPTPQYTIDDVITAIGNVFGKELAEAKQARESAAQASADVAPNPAGHPGNPSPPNETHAPVNRVAPTRNATVGHPSSGL